MCMQASPLGPQMGVVHTEADMQACCQLDMAELQGGSGRTRRLGQPPGGCPSVPAAMPCTTLSGSSASMAVRRSLDARLLACRFDIFLYTYPCRAPPEIDFN